MSDTKEPWEVGWDLLDDQPDGEAASEVLDGVISSYAAGYDTEIPEQRAQVVMDVINATARAITLPQPTDENDEPLDEPGAEEAYEKRRLSLTEHLANAYLQWEALDRGDKDHSKVN